MSGPLPPTSRDHALRNVAIFADYQQARAEAIANNLRCVCVDPDPRRVPWFDAYECRYCLREWRAE